MQDQLKPLPGGSNTPTSSPSDSLVKIFQWLEEGRDLKDHEAASFLRQLELSDNTNLVFLSLKMSKGFSPVTEEKTLKSYLKRLPTLGYMTVNGNCLILAGFYPKIASVCTLSDILEENPRAKFFLSRKVISRLLEWKLARWRER
nr:hypothetical protein [Parachryseolinea silvisoli]